MTVALVTGGRDFCEIRPSADHMGERRALGFALDWVKPSRVVVGDANGADRWAVIWCERRGVPYHVERADWSRGGRGGPERNQRMVDMRPDVAVRFPGGRGTADCAARCEKAGIDVFEVGIK